MSVEAGKTSTGSVRTELRENAVGLPGILMQGIATIGPSFAILASFVFIVGFAGIALMVTFADFVSLQPAAVVTVTCKFKVPAAPAV